MLDALHAGRLRAEKETPDGKTWLVDVDWLGTLQTVPVSKQALADYVGAFAHDVLPSELLDAVKAGAATLHCNKVTTSLFGKRRSVLVTDEDIKAYADDIAAKKQELLAAIEDAQNELSRRLVEMEQETAKARASAEANINELKKLLDQLG